MKRHTLGLLIAFAAACALVGLVLAVESQQVVEAARGWDGGRR